MKKYFLLIVVVALSVNLSGQEDAGMLRGQVSFISSTGVYVKFRSTSGISAGDTLFSIPKGSIQPALVVKNLSSFSCECYTVNSYKPALADLLFAKNKVPVKTEKKENKEVVAADSSGKAVRPESVHGFKQANHGSQHISGSFSVSSYSDFSDTGADNLQKFRYTLTLHAGNIADSKISLESHITFLHKPGEWEEVKSNIFRALKIYNLALVYEPVKTLKISVGRRINPKLSNAGASDGLQIEKSFGGFSVGVIAGARPDYSDYGVNTRLMQYGGYLGFTTKNKSRYTESSLAFMQQMNQSAIDRRFIYFQHSGSVIKNLYFIGTLEADIYKLSVDTVNHTEKVTNGIDLTGLYLSVRYRLSDKFTLTGTYDARKNVIYYETFRSFTDRIMEDQMRQGYRLQLNYRLTKLLTLGLQGGYRFLNTDPHPSRNIYGYLTYNNIPGLNSAITISGSYLESSFMNGQIYGAGITKDLLKGNLQTGLGYRYVNYQMPESSITDIQHIGEANLFWMIRGGLSFGINYEGTFKQAERYHRVYVQLRKRF